MISAIRSYSRLQAFAIKEGTIEVSCATAINSAAFETKSMARWKKKNHWLLLRPPRATK
jgi:hypothetical protein